jgi:chromosomal replication initiator protein
MNADIKQAIKDQLRTAPVSPNFYEEYLRNADIREIDDEWFVCIVSSFGKELLTNVEKDIKKGLFKSNKNVDFSFLTEEEYNVEKTRLEIKQKGQNNVQSFDNFIIGPSNKSALSAARNTIDYYCKWNPLLIYGGSGLGKTHLLNAISEEVRQRGDKKVIYITSETFRNEIVSALNSDASRRLQMINDFKDKYTDTDYFLLDDVQFFSSSQKTLEILFNIFNELVKNNKQIVMTSDKFVEKLNGFDNRMINRFISGLNIQISKLDQETSLNIINYKLKQNNFEMDDDAKKHIATFYSGDVRKIIGIFNQIDFNFIQGTLTSPVTLKDLDGILNNYTYITSDNVTATTIKSVVAKEYNTTVELLIGRSRKQPLTFARHIAMALCKNVLKLNYSQIGNEFGGRDHSTVMSAIDNVIAQSNKDKTFKKTWKGLLKKLGQ